MEPTIQDIAKEHSIETTCDVSHELKDHHVKLSDDETSITGLIKDPPDIDSLKFKEPSDGAFMVSVKYNSSVKEDEIAYY